MNDESIRDTLMDLANYAIMTIIELDEEQERVKMGAGRGPKYNASGLPDPTAYLALKPMIKKTRK